MTLDRRRFLQVITAGMLGGLAETACTLDSDSQALAQPALVEMLGSERAREIGAQYRAAVPAENKPASLRSAIFSSRGRGFGRMYRRSIEAQVHDDFEAGRTVLVGGWVLSRTEARQCALYSLSA